MSTERIKGKVAFICDGNKCPEGIETDCGDFHEALERAKSEGWLIEMRKGV